MRLIYVTLSRNLDPRIRNPKFFLQDPNYQIKLSFFIDQDHNQKCCHQDAFMKKIVLPVCTYWSAYLLFSYEKSELTKKRFILVHGLGVKV